MNLVYTILLLLFGSMLSFPVPNPQSQPSGATAAYDGRVQTRIAYDRVFPSGSDYDSGSESLASERENLTVKTNGIFARLTGTGTRGYTTPTSEGFLRPGLTRAQQAANLAHEGIHSFLTPKSGLFVSIRQQLRQSAYDNSQFVHFTEEVAAQTYATGSLKAGIHHGFNAYYQISVGGLATQGAIYGSAVCGGFYLGTQLGGTR